MRESYIMTGQIMCLSVFTTYTLINLEIVIFAGPEHNKSKAIDFRREVNGRWLFGAQAGAKFRQGLLS